MQNSSVPKVSVLIPAYNEEKYILTTLNALLNQRYPNMEIIVADNASTDRTSFLVKKFIQDLREAIPIILVHQPKQGTNYARECARQSATGDIIAQIDADCIPPPNWISQGVSALCNNKKAVAVTGPYDYFDASFFVRTSTLISQKIIYPLVNSLVQFTGHAAILIGGNAFIHAHILERAGGYNTAFTFYGDDAELGKRLSMFGFVSYLPKLTLPSSSRRYKADGFWKVNKKYQSSFWKLVMNQDSLQQTIETRHPR
jgi:glycosyltransferase involved in cell wall biosynthesis